MNLGDFFGDAITLAKNAMQQGHGCLSEAASLAVRSR
jgi:hypothetical protein